MKRYLWCEDSKSGYQFWKAIFQEIFPDVLVESKTSNTRLRKAAGNISEDGNQYYIVMDTVVDNPDVYRETKQLLKVTAGKTNVHLVQLHSFEYALLSFEFLEQWIFPETSPLKEKRQDSLHARDLFVQLISAGGDASELAAFKEAFHSFASKNTEQIAAKLLFEITRNTGFETDKSKLGECFINQCCEWKNRQGDDLCGLDSQRFSSAYKAKKIVEHSVLKESFEKAGI